MFGYRNKKVPLHCCFIFYCILKMEKSRSVSRHLWYCEVLRVLKGFMCFADLVVVVWFLYFPHREWVWSEVTEVIGRKMGQTQRNVCNLTRAAISEYFILSRAISPILHFAINTRDCGEDWSCMQKFPNKFVLFLLLFFNWNFSEFAQI